MLKKDVQLLLYVQLDKKKKEIDRLTKRWYPGLD